MALRKLILNNLVFYRRTNIGTLLGITLATAILVGALIVGDSVRYSLLGLVSERLGKTEFALDLGDQYFRNQLADDLEQNLKTTVAPILRTRGMAITPGKSRNARPVQIVGVDERFEDIGNTPPSLYHLQENEVIINEQLASKLGLKAGDSFLLRLLKIEYLSTDAPFSRDSDLSIATRVQIKAIASKSDFGHFNLKSHQIVPNTVFVSLSYLNSLMEINDRANILLIAARQEKTIQQEELELALEKVWTLEDIGLHLELLDDPSLIEMKSERIFIQSDISDKIHKIDNQIVPVFTYFVNEISNDKKNTPYSFVSAPGSPLVPKEMKDDEIIVNSWLAADLGIKKGDRIKLKYYIIGSNRSLTEKESLFKVRTIVPISGIYADQNLMPDFPGLAGEENCRDWDPGIPVDLDKIRKKDEAYWDVYRGIPKAFITIRAAQNLWQNRFGDLTAIRFTRDDISNLKGELRNALNPKNYGFVFLSLKQEGIRASQESVDFAELFLGLSFFVMIAALLLTSLLFILTIEQRTREIGLYFALGFMQKQVRRILLYEYGLLAIFGGVIGSFLGITYNQIIIMALRSVWKGAVGTSALTTHIESGTIITGAVAGILVAFLTMIIMIRNRSKRSVSSLQAGLSKVGSATQKKWLSRYNLLFALGTLISALFLIIYTGPGQGKDAAGAFFGSGFLVLMSGLAFTSYFFDWIQKKSIATKISLLKISRENMTRQKGRSLLIVGLLASGLFIIFTVGANRHGKIQDPYQRSAGTGGFALIGQTEMPVLYDLNTENDFYGLGDLSRASVEFLSFRVKEGDDASCLNLNRVSAPQLIGFDPDELNRRGAFTFASLSDGVEVENPWQVLHADIGGDIIPGIADETVIIWGLGKSVGDTITYHDEKGKKFYVKLMAGLANSIFQGNVLISEKNLMEKYPSISGHRMFLIDVPQESADSLSQRLSWGLQDLGISIASTSSRLDAFNQVENTYLSIFLILGGLGLILGTIGLGVVVARNVLERRGELALLKAVGFGSGKIQKLILSEHIYLLFIGSFCGLFASLIACPSCFVKTRYSSAVFDHSFIIPDNCREWNPVDLHCC